jgi:3D (Asp-Asp-Asp) domain-containing protein
MKSLLGGSSVIAGAALLSGSLLFSAKPSAAETLIFQFQQSKSQPTETVTQNPAIESAEDGPLSNRLGTLTGRVIDDVNVADSPVSEPVSYIATAYSLRGKTASGRYVSQGIIAADPRVLPLGSRVRLEAGRWSGEYLVADTGGRIKGRKIDIWTPSSREAMRFGRRRVKLTILSYGGKRSSLNRRVQS